MNLTNNNARRRLFAEHARKIADYKERLQRGINNGTLTQGQINNIRSRINALNAAHAKMVEPWQEPLNLAGVEINPAYGAQPPSNEAPVTLFSANRQAKYINKNLKTNRKKYNNIAGKIVKEIQKIRSDLDKLNINKIEPRLNTLDALVNKSKREFAIDLRSRILDGISAQSYFYNKKSLSATEPLVLDIDTNTIRLYTKIINTLNTPNQNVQFPPINRMDDMLKQYNKKSMNININSQISNIENLQEINAYGANQLRERLNRIERNAVGPAVQP